MEFFEKSVVECKLFGITFVFSFINRFFFSVESTVDSSLLC